MKIGKKDILFSYLNATNNFVKKNIAFWGKYKKNNYELLRKNRKFLMAYKGKRCFILGNGPSLASVDFLKLKNEYVFTVNQAAKNKNFENLNTNFHLWTDPNLFINDIDKSDDVISLVETMRKVKTKNNNPICFYPLNQKDFINKYHLSSFLKTYYISPELGWLYEKYNEKIDICKPTPVFGTVVQYGIYLAIYMGFSEIYLLGCDNTGIVNSINSLLNENEQGSHGYEISEQEKIRMRNAAKRNGIEIDARAYYNDIKSYRILYEYCKKRDILLANCSSRTVIDSLPRIDINNLLN